MDRDCARGHRTSTGLTSLIPLYRAAFLTQGMPRHAVCLTYDEKMVYSVGTPTALRIVSGATFKGYHRSAYDYIQQEREEAQVRRAREAQAAFLDRIADGAASGKSAGRKAKGATRMFATGGGKKDSAIELGDSDGDAGTGAGPGSDDEIELGRTTQPSGSSDGVVAAQARATSSVPASAPTASAAAAPVPAGFLRLTLRDTANQRVCVAVPPTKTVGALIKHYLKQAKLSPGLLGSSKLVFDGEEFAAGMSIEDAGLEDEDTLDVKVPAH